MSQKQSFLNKYIKPSIDFIALECSKAMFSKINT